jgi:hypothetical protein
MQMIPWPEFLVLCFTESSLPEVAEVSNDLMSDCRLLHCDVKHSKRSAPN